MKSVLENVEIALAPKLLFDISFETKTENSGEMSFHWLNEEEEAKQRLNVALSREWSEKRLFSNLIVRKEKFEMKICCRQSRGKKSRIFCHCSSNISSFHSKKVFLLIKALKAQDSFSPWGSLYFFLKFTSYLLNGKQETPPKRILDSVILIQGKSGLTTIVELFLQLVPLRFFRT